MCRGTVDLAGPFQPRASVQSGTHGVTLMDRFTELEDAPHGCHLDLEILRHDMADDTLSRKLKAHEALWRQLEPLSVQTKALHSGVGIHRLIEDADRARMLMRAYLGPIEDLRRSIELHSKLLDAATGLRGFQRLGLGMEKQFRASVSAATAATKGLRRLGLGVEGQFLLPELPDTRKLLEALEISGTVTALSRYRDDMNRLRQMIAAMTAPWLDNQNQLRSLRGLHGLQHIGHELHTKPAFDVGSAERLRDYLGDWRASVDWPSKIFTDAVERSGFYGELGLDPDLTYYPASAFDQAITNTGVKRAPPPFIRAYARPDDRRGEEEAGFERTNAAHDRLQRFESYLRAFIDQRMTATVGENWIKHRVPGDMRRRWKDKQTRALDEGEPKQPLISYADFTDYVTLIVRGDNWDQVFASVFRRKSLVQESLQRLYPIRICTMHARIVSQDDELYLHAETTRLLIAMDVEV